MVSQASYVPAPGPERNPRTTVDGPGTDLRGNDAAGRRGPCQVLCSWEPFQLSQGRSVEATPALRPPAESALLTPSFLPLFRALHPEKPHTSVFPEQLFGKEKGPEPGARHQLAHDCGDPRPCRPELLGKRTAWEGPGEGAETSPGLAWRQEEAGGGREEGRPAPDGIVLLCSLCHVTCLMPSPAPALDQLSRLRGSWC